MKANKILMLIQTIGMYLSQITVLVAFIILDITINTEKVNAIADHLGDAYLICMGVLLLISLINIIVPLFYLQKPAVNINRFAMNIKISQILWYIVNYILSLLVFLGMMNPLVWFAAPIYLVLAVLITYLYMLSTSMPLFLSYIRRMKWRKSASTVLSVLACISLFFFVFDVFGSIYLYLKDKDEEQERQKEDKNKELQDYERTH